MIAYLVEFLEEDPFQQAPYVLDLGTGNGHLLFALLEAREELSSGAVEPQRLCGVDYSPASIELSRAIGAQREEGCEQVVFKELDLRDQPSVAHLAQEANAGQGWDIVCDKGTVRRPPSDTARCRTPCANIQVALSSQPVHGKLPVDLYVDAVAALTRRSPPERPGIFFITSCNFTQEELEHKFLPAGFEVDHVVPSPTFMFVRVELTQGGQKGSTVTTVAFRRT